MSYLVLARKWRPQRFADVIGQDHVVLTLAGAVEKDRLAHAYLFAGPRGCGKTTTARLLAKVINCENRLGAEPCNECSSCRAIIDGRHLDVIEIDGASNRGIDEIRDLREKIGYAPLQGKSKIYIIDEVHMLTPQAFNALLKTLEEPPAHVYMVFATTEPHKVPATILSRCQRFNFKRLELPEIIGQLEKICGADAIEYERDALVLISRRADGSMRDAESLLDQCISAAQAKVDLEIVRQVLGLVDSQLIIELLGSISRRDRTAALSVTDRVVSSGLDLEEFFLAYIEGLRNLLVLRAGGSDAPRWLDLTDDEVRELTSIGTVFSIEDLLFLFRSAVRSFREFKGASQPRYHLEASFAEAASWESAVELSELIRRIDGIGGSGDGSDPGVSRSRSGMPVAGGAAKRAPEEHGRGAVRPKGEDRRSTEPCDGGEAHAPVMESSGASRDAVGYATIDDSCGQSAYAGQPVHSEQLEELGGTQQWEKFLAKIRETKLTLGIWLMSAQVKGIRGDTLILGFSAQNRFAREMIREEKNKRYIESQLEQFFGRRFVIETGETAETPRPRESEAPPTREPDHDAGKLVEDSPMVRRLVEEFDGEFFTENHQ